MKSTWLNYRGKKVLHCDYSYLPLHDFGVEVREAERIVCSQPASSVLELTDIRGISLTRPVVDALKRSSYRRKSYIIAEAVLVSELSGPKRTLLEVISRISGQPFTIFDRKEDALNWLVHD